MDRAERDQSLMRRAIELAYLGRFTTSPNPNVGCVIARDELIVGEGYHFRAGEPHAEVHALHQASDRARGATVYVTLEPCSHYGRTPPCALALIEAGVKRVVIAQRDDNPQVAGRGIRLLRDAGIEVESGLLEQEAMKLNLGFNKRMQTDCPYVRLKLAASLDGKTALANGESRWITGSAARADVQLERAQSCAILSTAATVIRDDARLTVRSTDSPILKAALGDPVSRQPLRVILDGQDQLTGKQKLFQQPGPIWVVRFQRGHALPDMAREVVIPRDERYLSLDALLSALTKAQINTLWVEAGATLAGALLAGGWVDELVLYLAPKLMGPDAMGLLDWPKLTQMQQVPELALLKTEQIGSDLKLTLKPKKICLPE